jgi:hypothetical protein
MSQDAVPEAQMLVFHPAAALVLVLLRVPLVP